MHKKILRNLNTVLDSLKKSKNKVARSRYNSIEKSLKKHLRYAKRISKVVNNNNNNNRKRR